MKTALGIYFFFTGHFGKSEALPLKAHRTHEECSGVLGEAEGCVSKHTNSIYTGIGQLIDRGLLVDSVLILHLHDGAHLQGPKTRHTLLPRVPVTQG